MIPRILQAELLKEDLWLVYFRVAEESRFPIMRVVPTTENPISCPGGELWCKQFGCVPGDNVFTRAEPTLLLEEGVEVPEDWEAPWEDLSSNDWVSE
jgi:hypothetical protein